ncbi:MAG: phosphoribosylanthranilate isomerase, partial [Fibrobacterota bacterium]
IFYPASPRFIEPEAAGKITSRLPPFLTRVGVFVNEKPEYVNSATEAAGITCVQLHGDYSEQALRRIKPDIIMSLSVNRGAKKSDLEKYRSHTILLDSGSKDLYGGTGTSFNWESALLLIPENIRLIIAGGLGPQNAARAVKFFNPYGIDLNSGVEESPGIKDPALIEAAVKSVREVC